MLECLEHDSLIQTDDNEHPVALESPLGKVRSKRNYSVQWQPVHATLGSNGLSVYYIMQMAITANHFLMLLTDDSPVRF